VPSKNTTRDFRPGRYFHVYGRAVGKRAIFGDADGRARFLALIANGLSRHDIACAAYALMPNHYHLLLRPRTGSISRLMQGATASYAKTFNALAGTSGPVFESPFGARRVEGPRDLLGVVAYIHLNPSELREPMPTSDAAYARREPRPSWLDLDPVRARFGGFERYVEYMQSAAVLRQARHDAPWQP
jgi:REP element-mobilizing transposase RayT